MHMKILRPRLAVLVGSSLLATAFFVATSAQVAGVPTCGGLTQQQATMQGYVTFVGGNGPDNLALGGLQQKNWIMTNGGADTVFTGNDDDIICTGGGVDQVLSGGGDDVISLGRGGDFASGQGGDDTIDGKQGNDRIHGDSEPFLTADDGRDDIHGGGDDDTIDGGGQLDNLIGGPGTDTVDGALLIDAVDHGFADTCQAETVADC